MCNNNKRIIVIVNGDINRYKEHSFTRSDHILCVTSCLPMLCYGGHFMAEEMKCIKTWIA